jgi:hypothetical protein
MSVRAARRIISHENGLMTVDNTTGTKRPVPVEIEKSNANPEIAKSAARA